MDGESNIVKRFVRELITPIQMELEMFNVYTVEYIQRKEKLSNDFNNWRNIDNIDDVNSIEGRILLQNMA